MKIKDFVIKNWKSIFLFALFSAIIFCILCIYFNVVKYSVNTIDDFTHYNNHIYIYPDNNFNLFDFANKYAVWDCINLGGRYFTMFIQILLGPNPYTDIIKKNGIVMSLNMILYFASLFIFIFSIISKIVIRNCKLVIKVLISLLVFISFVVLHNVYQFYMEIFTWLSGATSYSFPLSFLLLSASFFILYIESSGFTKKLLFFPILITSIAALGGSISIISVAFILMLSLLIYIILNKKITIVNLGLLFHYFCFALINIISPGNYHRLSANINNDISVTVNAFDINKIILAFNIASRVFTNRFLFLITKFNYAFVLLVMTCIVGYCLSKFIRYFNFTKIVLTILPLIFLPYISCFSFALGYQDKIQLFDRCYFIIDFCLIFTLFIIFVTLFLFIFNKMCLYRKKVFLLLIAIIVFFNTFTMICAKICNMKYSADDIELTTVVMESKNNKHIAYHNEYKEIINTLKANSGKENVKIKLLPYEKAPKYFMLFMDGMHIPYFAPKGEYLELFYDIKNISVIEE